MLVAAFFWISLVAATAPVVFAGLGISPGTVFLERLPQNFSKGAVFYISRGNPARDESIILSAKGPLASYISFTKKEILLPKGQHNTPVTISVNTGSLATGWYETVISMVSAEATTKQTQGESGQSITLGLEGKVRFYVTTEKIKEFSIKNLRVPDTEEDQIFGFSFDVDNTGNVDTRPSKVALRIIDNGSGQEIFTETFNEEQLPIVKALSGENITLSSQPQLNVGSYRAEVSVYEGENRIFQEERSFTVYPPGTLLQSGELLELSIEKEKYQENEPVKISAMFKNTGKVVLFGSLALEIFLHDKRIDVIKSDRVAILAGDTFRFEQFYRPSKKGSYSIGAYVIFGPRKSNEKRGTFTVGETAPFLLVMVLLCITIFGAVFVILFYRKKLKRIILPQKNPPKQTAMSPPHTRKRAVKKEIKT